MISSFYDVDTDNAGPLGNELADYVRLLVSDVEDSATASEKISVELVTAPCAVMTNDDARKVIKLYNADIVVWGRYSTRQLAGSKIVIDNVAGAGVPDVGVGTIRAGSNARISIGNKAQ